MGVGSNRGSRVWEGSEEGESVAYWRNRKKGWHGWRPPGEERKERSIEKQGSHHCPYGFSSLSSLVLTPIQTFQQGFVFCHCFDKTILAIMIEAKNNWNWRPRVTQLAGYQGVVIQTSSPTLLHTQMVGQKVSYAGLLSTWHRSQLQHRIRNQDEWMCQLSKTQGWKKLLHWHIAPRHLALDYPLAVKIVYAIPYIFLQFNEVLNAIKSYKNINVKKHVA